LQPRAAQKLLDLMPSVKIGTSRLVEREALAGFLSRVRETENTTALFERMRREKIGDSHKKPRSLVRRDLDPVGLASLPDSIGLSRGRLEVSFATVEQLAESLLILARILESDGERFVQEFEPVQPEPESEYTGEMEELFTGLEAMEKEQATRS
jgi:hypothetical protein